MPDRLTKADVDATYGAWLNANQKMVEAEHTYGISSPEHKAAIAAEMTVYNTYYRASSQFNHQKLGVD